MISVTRNRYTVELEDIGEGISGDYDPDDPTDVALLRFTVLRNGEPMDDASYCTNIPASTPENVQIELATFIMDEVYGLENVKKLCERLSWIDPSWLDKRPSMV